jgi:hypothetical protein
LDRIATANAEANPTLFRIAMKMATGSGKTTVMAMLIAWQSVNAARKESKDFSRAFLIITPGITIKDRLRVLLPSDPDNYYETRSLVPPDTLPDIRRAEIVITNYHVFQHRETLSLPKVARSFLQGNAAEPLKTTETDAEMLHRACGKLLNYNHVNVINDEAHHCYRHKVVGDAEGPLTGDDKKEAAEYEEAARLCSTTLRRWAAPYQKAFARFTTSLQRPSSYGAQANVRPKPMRVSSVSIHAPAWGAAPRQLALERSQTRFDPRPRVGGGRRTDGHTA